MKRIVKIFLKLPHFVAFVVFLFYEMLISSILLARDIVIPGREFVHGIICIELSLKSDTAVIALVNLVSMTPGSLSIELSEDRRLLYIHAIYLEDPERFRRKVKNQFEKRIQKIFE